MPAFPNPYLKGFHVVTRLHICVLCNMMSPEQAVLSSLFKDFVLGCSLKAFAGSEGLLT